MDEFIALSPIPGTNGFENRMTLPCHSPNTTPGEFTESSGNFLSTLMDSGDLMVSNNADIQGNIHQGEKYSGSDSMDILDPATLHSFINQDQSNICDQKKPFQNSGIPLDNETYNCENCGRLMRRRLNSMSQLQRFCSNECAKLINIGKKLGATEIKVSATGVATTIDGKPVQINWDNYLRSCQNKMAPVFYFRHNTIDVPGVNPGMKLEAIDKHNPQSFCVATVVQVVGHRLRFRYDGYGRDSSHDVWCNFQAEELHPIGWCAQNGFPLQPPNGINCTLEEWRTFLTQTLTGALAAPRELFRKDHLQPRVHGFKVGMKLEVIHPAKPSVICPATVVKSLGPYYFLVATDYIQELPSVTFCCHSDSNGIYPAGWSYKNGIELTVPSNYAKKTFSWEKYMASCHASYAPQNLFKKTKSHKFKAGSKLEAVDLVEPSIIRVATITNVMGRVLQLFFDGQSRFQFVECDCPDMYPIGWCRRTGHPLHTEYGKSEWCKRTGHPLYRDYGKLASKTPVKPDEPQFYEDKLKLISFNDVISRKNETASKQSSLTSPSPLATPQRKPTILSSAVKPVVEIKDEKNEKCQPLSPSDDDDDISDDEGNGTGSERFYHNKNQIFFNKSCCCGPLLNPEEVKLLPDATEPGKVSTVIRTGLEKVARCAKDPEKVMDMMQEGSGVRVVLKHKGKILKKAISRVDSRPKLERYLKRFCRRLVCCEYFLSLTPVASPCPDKCKADEHGSLQGPKGLKAKRSREYFETKHLGYEKKKRGRKSKSDLAASEAAAQRAAAGIVTTVFHKGDRVPLPNLDLPVTAIADHLRNTASQILNQTGQQPSENRILPKPVLSSTTILTHTNPPVSITNNAPPPAAAVPTFGKPRLLPSPCQTTSTPRTVNPPPAAAEPQIVRPVKNAVLGRPPSSTPLAPAMTRGPIVQPRPISPATPTHHVVATSYAINTSNKPPLLPQPTVEQGNVVSSASVAANTKPVFRLAAAKFTPSHVARSTNPSKFPTRLLAVRQPLPRGVSYRFALQPRPKIMSSQANMVTTHHALPTSTSLTRVGPPPLIPARSLSGMPNNPNTSQGIQVMKTSPQDVLLKKVVTAAPNVCVTDRGTFTTQMSKVTVSANTATPIIGQSPDANAMMNKMFSVVKYSENGVMLTQPATSVVNSGSHTQSSRANQSKTQDTKAPVKSTLSGPSLQKLSINVGGGMGAVTTAVRAGLVPKEDSRDPTGSSDPREKSITQGGGFSITINDNHLESSTPLADGTPNESETNDVDDGKIEGELEGASKRALWLHRRRKKKKVRFTYVKGKARKKREEELYGQMNDDSETKQQEPSVQAPEQSVMMKTLPLGQIGELPRRGRPPSKVDEKEGKRRGRPPKRSYLDGEDLDDEKDPLFTPPHPVQVSPKRFQRSSSYPLSAMQRKYNNMTTPSPDNTRQHFPRHRTMVTDVNNTDTPTETTTATTTCMTSPKAELMKGVLHAVQSSQHPSVKLRSPLGKQSHPINGFSGPSPKRSRLLSSGSPTSRKPRGFYSTSPKFSKAVSPRSPQKRIPTFASIGTNTSLPGCSSDACIYHPQNPKAWTIEQVAEYVRATDCKNYATLFMDQEVDGESLLLLTRNALMQFTNMKLGPTLKMSNYIAQLRARAGSLNGT